MVEVHAGRYSVKDLLALLSIFTFSFLGVRTVLKELNGSVGILAKRISQKLNIK